LAVVCGSAKNKHFGLCVKLRTKSGFTEDGARLVDIALCGSAPRVSINDLTTESQRSEQSGFANLVKGIFGMFRNPTAHEAHILWAMSKEDAEDLLSLASLIHRRLGPARNFSGQWIGRI
jgi:uncharacterized protein (TIGR02391 family)